MDKIYVADGNGMFKPFTPDNLQVYLNMVCQKNNRKYIDIGEIVNNVFPKLKSYCTVDEIEAQIIASCSDMAIIHNDYPKVAVKLLISNLHRNTSDDIFEVACQLKNNINQKGTSSSVISDDFYGFIANHKDELNAMIDHDQDYNITLFGFRTLEKSYLKKSVHGKIIERPQHMWMRVAVVIHGTGIREANYMELISESYRYLSHGYFTHATPTLFNAGTNCQQMSSCFLLGTDDDINALGESWKDCATMSKYAGGIGLYVSSIRMQGAYINSTQGSASGLRLLKVYNEVARVADQGGKRPGSIAVYIEPWHGDIFFFLDLKKKKGS
jgi:ribonucleotide reductase alpha subunit